MGKRNYAYNEKFFGEWLEKATREKLTTKKKLMVELGTNNDGLIRWSEGDYPKTPDGKHKDKTKPRDPIEPMKADKIVLLCNHYGLDISSFFLENGKATTLDIKKTKTGRQEQKTQSELEMMKLRLEYMEKENKMLSDINELHKKLEQANDTIMLLQAELAKKSAPITERREGRTDEKGAATAQVAG